VTRERKLKEVLNVRLDEPLARELRRLAATRGVSESQVARLLLGYGIEVSRRLEATRLSQPWAWEKPKSDDPFDLTPGIVEIEAKWRPMTDEELAAHGLHEWISYVDNEEEYERRAP
jgi:hypothetical protein